MKKMFVPKRMKQYAIWSADTNDHDAGYWNLFDSIEDAVSEGGDGTEVFVIEPRRLGKFKRKVEMVKIPQRKRKSK
jgi:hypothetical protein